MAAKRGPKWGAKICVKEEFKIAVKIALDKFRLDEDQKDLEFPSSFTATERAYVHRISQNLGLKTKSQGKGANRFLVASKKEVKSSSSNSKIKLCQSSNQCIEALMKKFPLNTKEKLELFPKTERLYGANENGKANKDYKFVGKLGNTPPQVPPPYRDNDLLEFRKSLPIYTQRNEILQAIEQHQVVMISGETGSGKTTQVTQFILENASNKSQPCRIICTQPRRISALSVAERVATERGEKIAQTVGYQIRLDSRISGKTVLTYCTNGVLLRTMMQADDSLSYITHIIVDEIHERDRFADFLLISLRDILSVNKKIKLILMSAALDINLFVEYFGNCPVIHVPGRCFEVKDIFLEDVLGLTGYQNKGMQKHFKDEGKVSYVLAKTAKDLEQSIKSTTTITESAKLGQESKSTHTDKDNTNKPSTTIQDQPFESQHDETDDIIPEDVGILLPDDDDNDDVDDDDNNDDATDATDDNVNDDLSNNGYDGNDEGDDVMIEDDDDGHDDDGDDDGDDDANLKALATEVKDITLEPTSDSSHQIEDNLDEEDVYLRKEMDDSISEAWLNGSDDSFVQILHLIMNENISVDYQHSETQVTALMVAAGRGCAGVVEQLILLGANPHITDPKNGWSALDWAKKWENAEIVEMLETYISSPQTYTEDIALEKQDKELSDEVKELLSVYHKTFDDDKVDLDLIVSILDYICSLGKQGAVLVFLPGYDEIITLRDRLGTHNTYGNSSRYQIFMLHSSMQPSEQRKVFRKLPSTVRKIILSTNIAETSLTIDDVVFVIDSGKVKEKSFDALTSVSTLHPVWISKASSIQRKGRAGRCSPGVCFHLFSHARYESFQSYQVPEMLRMPLQELCLHTKLLSGPNTSIADFLAKAPEPPAFLILRNAVTLLKTIDALDNWEDLTDLGHHLADLPLEPRLGKMVLYSVMLKCIDPVITIACALAYRDPFVLPMYAAEKRSAALAKKKFILDPYSDHLLFVKAFRGWQRAKADGYDKSYCQKNYLSPATLEIMAGMRSQMIVHLKASGFIRPRGAGDMRDLNTNSNNWAVVKAALCAGMYPNVVRVDRENNKLMTPKESKVRLHTSSILCESPDKKETMAQAQAKAIKQIPTDWLIYEEMTRMHVTVSIKCCTAVSPITVSLFTGPSLSSPNLESGTNKSRDQDHRNSEGHCNSESSDSENDESKTGAESLDEQAELKVDNWISLCGKEETVHLTTYLRHKLQALFIRRIRSPSRPWSQVDEAIVRATVAVLTAEEESINPSMYAKQRKPRQDYPCESRTRDERPRPMERFSPRDRLRDSPVPSWRSRQTNSPVPQANNRRSVETTTQFRSQPSTSDKLSEARYFIIKCNNQRNLSISMAKGIWATTIANEKKLNRAYRESKKIVLIFSVQGSGHFQGFAYMASPIGKEKSPEFGSSSLGGVFKVDWIKKANIPFQEAHHLVNPWNDHKKVQISRDGQELEPTVGAELCKLWDTNGSSSQYARASVQRRGQRSVPTQQDQNPNHWQQSQSPTPMTTPPQMYAPHASSMPIPVPIPSHHAHGTVMQRFPPQRMTGINQAPIGYTAHPVAIQPNPNMAGAMRYPSNAPVIGLQFQQGGPSETAVLRPNSYPSQ